MYDCLCNLRLQSPTDRKGQVKPVSIEAKVRQGRKTSTFITSFEHFGINATELAEELRKVCAGSTSGKLGARVSSRMLIKSIQFRHFMARQTSWKSWCRVYIPKPSQTFLLPRACLRSGSNRVASKKRGNKLLHIDVPWLTPRSLRERVVNV